MVNRRKRRIAPHLRPYGYYKETYGRHDLKLHIRGRKVKKYMLVHMADDAIGDEFIPIFEKRKKRYEKLRSKKLKLWLRIRRGLAKWLS